MVMDFGLRIVVKKFEQIKKGFVKIKQ